MSEGNLCEGCAEHLRKDAEMARSVHRMSNELMAVMGAVLDAPQDQYEAQKSVERVMGTLCELRKILQYSGQITYG